MILTCPACATRYQADAAKFPPSGRDVRCAKCGHVWHQLPPEPEIETVAVIAEPEPTPQPVPQAFAPPPSRAMELLAPKTSAPSRPQRDWPRVAALAAGWIGLAVILLSIGTTITLFRHQLVSAWPQSASLYAGIGAKTNASGLEVDNLKYHEETQDGQPVLAVSGTLVNISRSELPLPQIRLGLSDRDNRELYHWIFTPDVMTLGPGQSYTFVTRLSSPPAAARHLDVRFAKAGE
jgi:predicted Zn finger-like uncharacterized protein